MVDWALKTNNQSITAHALLSRHTAQPPPSEQDASCARSLAWLGEVYRAGPAVDAARQIILVLAALTAGLRHTTSSARSDRRTATAGGL